MTAAAPRRMTGDAFITWAMEQPEGKRYELVTGEVVAIAPERAVHARTKGRIHGHLAEAIRTAGLPCEAFPDGMAVRVDVSTVYEPDAMVRCGTLLPDDATITTHIIREGDIHLDPPGLTLTKLFDQ